MTANKAPAQTSSALSCSDRSPWSRRVVAGVVAGVACAVVTALGAAVTAVYAFSRAGDALDGIDGIGEQVDGAHDEMCRLGREVACLQGLDELDDPVPDRHQQ